ncbi:helix-turn-helix domain-containing protein [Sinorhizobium americanum]|uniref:helix-turn-helix domain-containing protein n=1 Tax=Sinorhizobium americanum TaxID=194963 RepID=UPI001404597A
MGLSRRQLERLFATHLGVSPSRHYVRIRIDFGKRLIAGTRMPLIDVATAWLYVCITVCEILSRFATYNAPGV